MSAEKGQNLSQQDLDVIIGDGPEPDVTEVIHIKPRWQEEARRRSETRDDRESLKVKFQVPRTKEATAKASHEIGKFISGVKRGEMMIVFTDHGNFAEIPWEDEGSV